MKQPGPQAGPEFWKQPPAAPKNGANPYAPSRGVYPSCLPQLTGMRIKSKELAAGGFAVGGNPEWKQRLSPLPLPSILEPREARHADWVNPKGGAHGCAPFPEAQDAPYGNSQSACEPNGFIVGRAVGRLSFGYFSLPFKEK